LPGAGGEVSPSAAAASLGGGGSAVRAAAAASDCVRAAGVTPRGLAAARRRHPAHQHHSSRRHSHAARRSRDRARRPLCCLRRPCARHRRDTAACRRRSGSCGAEAASRPVAQDKDRQLPQRGILAPPPRWVADCGAAAHGGGGCTSADHRHCCRRGPTADPHSCGPAACACAGATAAIRGFDRHRAPASAGAGSLAGLGGANGSPPLGSRNLLHQPQPLRQPLLLRRRCRQPCCHKARVRRSSGSYAPVDRCGTQAASTTIGTAPSLARWFPSSRRSWSPPPLRQPCRRGRPPPWRQWASSSSSSSSHRRDRCRPSSQQDSYSDSSRGAA